MSVEDEESTALTLLEVPDVSVYKIPPRSTSEGYKCGDWLQSDKIWSGRLRIVSFKDRCEIQLEESNSDVRFAVCFVQHGKRELSVEAVLDSSRYFVLKIENGEGKHAFIGLGFSDRNEAFDFNVALSCRMKYASREQGGESDVDDQIDMHPAVDHRLKEGETMRINVKTRPSAGTGMLSAAGLACGLSGDRKGIAPPPSAAGKSRSPIPPPPNDRGAGPPSALSDLSPLERNLPSPTRPGKSTASGWTAF